MDRRNFLRGLLGAAAATVIAPVAPKVIYCFAPPSGWRSSAEGLLLVSGPKTLYGVEQRAVEVESGLSLNFIDLEAPAYLLDPIFSRIRDTMPQWVTDPETNEQVVRWRPR